jgi:hypothetical protein
MRAKRRVAQELRQAIDCLPERTRRAMLDGIEANDIIVGAYTDRRGGVCPMLAAHRHGGRTSLASFAKAWDRYTGARKRPRPATERELRTLRAMLEASLIYGGESELATAAAEHRESRKRKAEMPRVRRDTGEKSRLKELRNRPGWAWLRVFRRYDDFQAALAQAESEEKARLAVPGPDEADLRDDAGRGRAQQETHSLR